ncbi:MAG: hypothetical protein NZ805_13205 [Armatimonadetes bacterium]|nr:hypothetical protein [Armatimonadota bacterium]MDW8027893.1 hypothetical protein [Armatimonadota bacterium]
MKGIECKRESWRLIAMKSNNGQEMVDMEAIEMELGLKRTKP